MQESQILANRRASYRRGFVGGLTAIAASLLLWAIGPPAVAADDIYNPYGVWNGKRIYLSPATHPNSGSRGECLNQSENSMAYGLAYWAANTTTYNGQTNSTSEYRNLRSRGYLVRIGRSNYTQAVTNSNSWNATLHIPLHSNAPGGTFSCSNTTASSWGARVMYQSTADSELANDMKVGIGGATPGTSDRICTVPQCSSFTTLHELSAPNAVAAYMETEFHTWNTGASFLGTPVNWAWRIGSGVDAYLNFPRGSCPCPI